MKHFPDLLRSSWIALRNRRSARLQPRRRRSLQRRLMLEVLEDRTLLSTLTVDSTSDFSANDGVTTLREAIVAANQSPGHDTIVFDPIVFAPSPAGHTIFTQGFSISDHLTIIGPGADVLTITKTVASGEILRIVESASLELSQVTIADSGPGPGNFPSRPIESRGDLTIRDVTFRDNRYAAINHSGEELLIENSRFINNRGSHEGAITLGGNSLAHATIIDTVFENNRSARIGGAIRGFVGHLTVIDSLFKDNSAGVDGGAIQIDATFGASQVDIINSTFTGNAAGRSGGAIVGGSNVDLAVTNSTFAGNSAGSDGGAILMIGFNFNGAATVVANTTFSGNSAGRHGGAITFSPSGGALTVTNSTLVFNRGDSNGDGIGSGGGIANFPRSFPVDIHTTLHNTIVAGNTIGAAGLETPNDLTNTVAGNTLLGVEPTSSHNLIGDAASSGDLVNGVNHNIVGVDVNDVIDALADNGGPTLTHALLAGSPAQNAGNNSLVPADTFDLDGDNDTTEAIPFDQRSAGFDRISGGTVDIGAYEINNQPPVLTPDNISDEFQLDVFYSDGGIISGPLIGDLSSLPQEIEASFVIDTSNGGTSFGLSDVVSALASFAGGVWDETLLDSFDLQIDPVSGAATGLTYEFRTIDIAAADGVRVLNFPLTIRGTDTATGQPFEYRYTESTQLMSAAIYVAENQTFVFDFDSVDPDEETEAGGGLTYSLTGGADQGLFSIDADTGVLTFNTAPDFENPGDADGDNTYNVRVAVTDSGGLSDSQDVAVFVTDVNEPPTVSGPLVVTTNEDAVAFSLNLLAGASDPDTADVLNVTNLMLTGGDDAGVNVIGNSLDVDPSAYNHLAVGESEVISYSYDIIDGNGGSVAQTATITIEGRNDASTGADFTRTGTEDSPLALSAADFISAFSDPDTEDSLHAIRIDALSADGTLELKGVAVTAGQIISAAELDDLVFIPNLNFNGETAFTWSAGDGIDFAATPATMTLDILSAAEQVDRISGKIDELLDAGTINEGQANSLKLNLKDNNGDAGKAQAFLNEVLGYINGGILTEDEAHDLLVCGNLLLVSLLTT